MNPEDVVDPGDAALQSFLAAIAACTPDGERRDRILDLIVTRPPLGDWPTASLEQIYDITKRGAGRS